jgi:mannitol-specific phosphotransferase system IIBC component
MPLSIPASQVKTIYFACEAGMGSSLMSASWLIKRLSAAHININIIPKPVAEVPADAQVVLVHKGLVRVIRLKAPNAVILTFDHFLTDPVFNKLIEALVEDREIVSTEP